MEESLIRMLISVIRKYTGSKEDYVILKENARKADLSLYSLHVFIEAVNRNAYNDNSLNMNGFVKIMPESKETRLIEEQQEENESLRVKNKLLEVKTSSLIKKHKITVFFLCFLIIAFKIFLFQMWQSNKDLINEADNDQDKELVIDTLKQVILSQGQRIKEMQTDFNEINRELKTLKTNQGSLTEKENTIDSMIQIKESLESDQKSILQIKDSLQKIMSEISNYQPIVIKSLKIGNVDSVSNIITTHGDVIYADRTMYLQPQIEYVGLTPNKTITLYLRLYKNDILTTGDYSPTGYSMKDDLKLQTEGKTNLIGWGNSSRGYWPSDNYRYEIWYNNTCLKSVTFKIY